MLMKGLEEHDAELQQMLDVGGEDRRVVVPIVLWTESTVSSSSGNNHDTDSKVSNKRQFVKVEQLRQELLNASTASASPRDKNASSHDPPVLLLLIALEGTWGQARRMSNKLPASVRGLSLSTEEIFGWRRVDDDRHLTPTSPLIPKSIIQPLRKQKTTRNLEGDIVDAGKVCTAEAVVSALLSLSVLNTVEAASLLDIAEQKVKDTAAYQGDVRMLS